MPFVSPPEPPVPIRLYEPVTLLAADVDIGLALPPWCRVLPATIVCRQRSCPWYVPYGPPP